MLQSAVTLHAHKGAVLAVAFNSDGVYCMSGGDDRRVLLWNPRREDVTPIKEYTGHSQRILDIAIAPDNGSFVSCGGDRSIFVWDVPSGRVSRRLQVHSMSICKSLSIASRLARLTALRALLFPRSCLLI